MENKSSLEIPVQIEKNDILSSLLNDLEITEIITNGPNSIWYEKAGKLFKFSDSFTNEEEYNQFLEELYLESRSFITYEDPFADGKFRNFRLSVVGKDITQNFTQLNLRRHPVEKWSLELLCELEWCNIKDVQILKKLVNEKINFVVIGATGSGKTTISNALLNELNENERAVIIEDTFELQLPNEVSSRLLTRDDKNGSSKTINQNTLLKKSLRMRPDRIILGEIRGEEAKDFLLALATGHEGSFGTLHATSAAQALIRLEMLIQMGAPQWEISAIRKLIHLSLKNIIVTKKDLDGKRKLDGIYQITSLEESGFLLEKIN